MKRTTAATLLVLGLATSALEAQQITLTQPLTAQSKFHPPPVQLPPYLYSYSIQSMVSVTTLAADSRRVTFRTASGATILVDFWYPTTPPSFSVVQWIDPVPGVLMTRALMGVQANPSYFAGPITLSKVLYSRFDTALEACSETTLDLTVPNPAMYPGNGDSGGLHAVHLAASGQVAVDGALTYGYVTLYQDPKGDHDYYFISPANTLWGLTPISGAAADDLSNDLFGNPYWVQFGNDPHTTTQGARLIWAGAAWSTN